MNSFSNLSFLSTRIKNFSDWLKEPQKNDFSIIVVDDGSSEECQAIFEN